MQWDGEFFNLYQHGFIRVALGVPEVRVADPVFNAARTVELIERAGDALAVMAVFPELGLTAYSCEDLFHQQTLLDGAQEALGTVMRATRETHLIAVVGLPLQVDHLLFNCAAVLHQGRILGVVPKSFLPNYREYYEMRQFVPAAAARRRCISLCGQSDVPFGDRLLFRVDGPPTWAFFVEICEDLWVPIPPSSYAAMAGATVLVNLSASNVTISKDEYRNSLVANQSARCLAAYLYTAAGAGESTTDLAWDGHAMAYENGLMVAESQRFQFESQLVLAELDVERLSQERMRQTTFGQSLMSHAEEARSFREVRVSPSLPDRRQRLLCGRVYDRFPYVPANPPTRDRRCYEAYNIQVQGLVKRLRSTGIENLVIGISGGLDSTHALIVAARAADLLGLPRSNIKGYTMPGFATSTRTLRSANALMAAIGCEAHELDIRPSCEQMLRDLGHPLAEKPWPAPPAALYDVTFENVQAGERTSHLFRFANLCNGLVVGTGDLSELALGWCTYGVGDHMSHYNVNASVPKTLIRYLINWVAETGQLEDGVSRVLRDVLETEVSPELLPGADDDGQPSQRTEEVIGPYELHDFFLYYTTRFGYLPSKIAFLAYCCWHDPLVGHWPEVPLERRRVYNMADIKQWLTVFAERFFQLSQFKRSCVPNAPKVGSGGSLSPRGDYRAPSDAEAALWLEQIRRIPDRD